MLLSHPSHLSLIDSWLLPVTSAVLIVSVGLGLLRIVALLVTRRGRTGYAPFAGISAISRGVSVVIPALEEASGIERCLRSVLTSEEVDLDVIVVDAVSPHRTGDLVARVFGADLRVRVIRAPGLARDHALDLGLKNARHDLVVALAAETVCLSSTLRRLARAFDDPQVGCVAGCEITAGGRELLAGARTLEALAGKGVERRAWHSMGLVALEPGQIGAWRRDAVREAGGFSRRPGAAADLSLELQSLGWLGRYAPDAFGFKEATVSARAVVLSRVRSFCTLIDAAPMASRPSFGMVSLSLGLYLLAWFLVPLADIAALLGFVSGHGAAIAGYVVAALLVDWVLTLLILSTEEAKLGLARSWPAHRFVYRWFLVGGLFHAAWASGTAPRPPRRRPRETVTA